MKYFTNPYNFVPLEGRCHRSSHALGKDECLTGYFDCTIELLTPLFIPNTSCSQALCDLKEAEAGYSGYEFNSYENLSGTVRQDRRGQTPPKEPIISGSEIRGSVRSVFEAAFGGCMSTIAADATLGRRTPSVKKPGILRKKGNGGNEYEIIPCERAMLFVERPNISIGTFSSEKMGQLMPKNEYNTLKEGQEIWIKLADEGFKKGGRNIGAKVVRDYKIPLAGKERPKDYLVGYLHKGEPFGKKKHHESVFYIDGNRKGGKSKVKAVSEEEINMLQTVMEEYWNPKRRHDNSKSCYQEFDLHRNQILVYYCDDEGVPSYMSPACIGKEVYTKTLRDILEKNGGFQPCNKRDELCPACGIFGMVSGKEGCHDAVGSRVRFADAVLKTPFQKDVRSNYMDELVLPESGEPRPGAVEFYTIPPYKDEDAKTAGWTANGYWTYDYMCVIEKGKARRKDLEENLPKIRGRKFYWHSSNWQNYANDNKLDHLMKQRIRPLKKSNLETEERLFCFRVYFDRLNQTELEQLRWALDFADSSCAHKIGRGKPLGFGSVKIRIDNLKIQTLDKETGELKLVSGDYDKLGVHIDEAGNPIKTLKLMADYQNRPLDVGYPEVDNGQGKQSFRWFGKNRIGFGSQTEFLQVLPKAVEEYGPEKNQMKRLNMNGNGMAANWFQGTGKRKT